MNTGLALRKPLESSLGAAHRFLVANGTFSRVRLMRSLNAFVRANEFHPPGYYAILAQRWEQQFCQTHRLPYYAPEPVPLSMALRNCPLCAAAGYHSLVYQWAWLSHCPVHRTSLVGLCPECHDPWPSVVDLLQRQCPGCGWPIHRQQLCQRQAFTNSWLAIEALRDLQQDYASIAKARLTAVDPSRHALDEHQSIAIGHPDFASIYAYQFPGRHAQLLTQQTSVQPVTCFRFPLPVARRGKYRSPSPERPDGRSVLGHLAPGWRRRVKIQIIKAIECYRQRPLVIPRFCPMEFEGLDGDTDCFLMAFIYWQKLVGNRPDHPPPHSRYFDQGAGSYPLIPVPMEWLSLATDGADQVSGFLLPSRFPVPLEVTQRVYELDLWWCFKSLLTYFDTLKSQRDAPGFTSLGAAAPDWAWPGRPYNEAMGIFVNRQRALELVIPTARLSWSLEDLSLLAT